MSNEFKDRLKFARKKANMTQAQLAKAINTTQGNISDLESGRNKSSTSTLQIASVLKVNPTWLALGNGNPDDGVMNEQNLSVQMNSNTVTNGSSLHQNIDAQRQLEEQMIRSGQQCTDIVYYEHADLTQQSTIAIAQGVINRVPDILRSPDELFAFPMASQDMTPIIASGSLVVADTKKARIPIYDGKIYALKMGNLVRCFYLSQISADEIRVYSVTDKGGEVLKRANFDNKYQIMGGVVWWSSFMEW